MKLYKYGRKYLIVLLCILLNISFSMIGIANSSYESVNSDMEYIGIEPGEPSEYGEQFYNGTDFFNEPEISEIIKSIGIADRLPKILPLSTQVDYLAVETNRIEIGFYIHTTMFLKRHYPSNIEYVITNKSAPIEDSNKIFRKKIILAEGTEVSCYSYLNEKSYLKNSAQWEDKLYRYELRYNNEFTDEQLKIIIIESTL